MPTSNRLNEAFFYRFTSYFLKTAIFFATHKSVVHFILPSEKMATSHQHISVAFPRGCNIPTGNAMKQIAFVCGKGNSRSAKRKLFDLWRG